MHEAEHSNAERPEISEERKGKLGAGAVHINEAMMATAEPEVAEVSPAKQSIIEKLRARRVGIVGHVLSGDDVFDKMTLLIETATRDPSDHSGAGQDHDRADI